jgi:hypothetical protein
MDTKMYWKGLGILGIALLGTATVFYQLGKKDIQTNISAVGSEKKVDTVTPLIESGNTENQVKDFIQPAQETKSLMYKNSDFGSEFTLSLPESWKGYAVEKDGTTGIRFYLPSTKYASVLKYQTNRVPVLFIEAAPKAKIDNLSSQCSHASTLSADDQYACNWLPVPGKSYYLGKNSQYYFSFRGPVGEPTINIDDFPVKMSPELTALEKETKAVVNSFQSQ